MKETINQFKSFLSTVVNPNTGTIHSYIRAMRIVDEVLRTQTDVLNEGESLWEIRNETRLREILMLIKQERAKP